MRQPYRVEVGLPTRFGFSLEPGGHPVCVTRWAGDDSIEACTNDDYTALGSASCYPTPTPAPVELDRTIDRPGPAELVVEVITTTDECKTFERSSAAFRVEVIPPGAAVIDAQGSRVEGTRDHWGDLQAALDTARQRWARASRSRPGYWWRTRMTCFCLAGDGITTIDASGTRIRSFTAGGESIEGPTVEDVFNDLQRIIDENKHDSAHASFDPDSGMPVSWSDNPSNAMADEETGAAVVWFAWEG